MYNRMILAEGILRFLNLDMHSLYISSVDTYKKLWIKYVLRFYLTVRIKFDLCKRTLCNFNLMFISYSNKRNLFF